MPPQITCTSALPGKKGKLTSSVMCVPTIILIEWCMSTCQDYSKSKVGRFFETRCGVWVLSCSSLLLMTGLPVRQMQYLDYSKVILGFFSTRG